MHFVVAWKEIFFIFLHISSETSPFPFFILFPPASSGGLGLLARSWHSTWPNLARSAHWCCPWPSEFPKFDSVETTVLLHNDLLSAAILSDMILFFFFLACWKKKKRHSCKFKTKNFPKLHAPCLGTETLHGSLHGGVGALHCICFIGTSTKTQPRQEADGSSACSTRWKWLALAWHNSFNSLAWHRHTCIHWLYIDFMSLRTSLQHATWQSATPMLFFTMPRLCPRLSDQRQRDGWPQHMVPHEFHHSPKLHGQNTPWGHNHDGDPDVWIKILSVKWRSIWISSTYKSQLCKFWDVLFSSFKFCFNSNESFSMNPMGAEWEPNEFSAMQGTVLSPPKVPSKPSHEAGFSVMHLLSADRLPRRGHLDLIVKALEHFEDPTPKYAKQTNKPQNCRQSSGESRRRCLNHYQSHTRPIGSDPAWIHSSRWCHSAWITDRLKSINNSWTTDPFIAIDCASKLEPSGFAGFVVHLRKGLKFLQTCLESATKSPKLWHRFHITGRLK